MLSVIIYSVSGDIICCNAYLWRGDHEIPGITLGSQRCDTTPAKANKLDILVSSCSLIMGKYMITILYF